MFRSVKFWLMVSVWLTLLGVTILIVLNREVTHLSIAAGHRDTEMYEVGSAIAKAYKERHPEIDVAVYETQGSAENAHLLNSHKVDFSIILSDTVATEGVGAVARLFEDNYMLFVREDSGINSLTDLKGRKIAVPPMVSGQVEAFWYLMEHFGVKPRDVEVKPMQGHAANFAMKQHQIDAIFRISALGAEVNFDLVRLEPNIKMIPVTQPQALAIFHPVLRKGVVPIGAFRGSPALPVNNIVTVAEDTVLAANKEVPAETVRKITATLFERKASLIQHSPFAGHAEPIDNTVNLALPLHEGARRYYDREKPSFLQQNSRMLSTMLYIITLLATASVALRAKFKRNHRVHMKAYNVRLIDASQDAENAISVGELAGPKRRLATIMDEVIRELDDDLVSSDEFARFSFTWRATERVVHRRERELAAGGQK